MFDLVVIVRADSPEKADGLRDALARMRPLCLSEPGCMSWEAYQSQTDPATFTLVERWESEAHWRAHEALTAIQTVYVPEVIPRASVREVHPSRRL